GSAPSLRRAGLAGARAAPPGARADRRPASEELDRRRRSGGLLRSQGQRRGRSGGDGDFRSAVSARTARRAPSGERLAAAGRGPARGTSRAGSSRGGGALRGARRNVSRRAGLGGVARPLSRAEAASRGAAGSGGDPRLRPLRPGDRIFQPILSEEELAVHHEIGSTEDS